MRPTRFLQVAIPSPLYRSFDYLPPPDADPATLRPGVRLALPFGRREVVGVLLATLPESNVPAAKLKAARRLLDESPLIPEDMLPLARWRLTTTAIPSVRWCRRSCRCPCAAADPPPRNRAPCGA